MGSYCCTSMRQTRIAKKQQAEQSMFMNRIIEENEQARLPTLRHRHIASSKIGPNGRLLSPNHANSNRNLRVDEQLAQHPLIEPSLRLSKRRIQWIPKQLFQLSYIENLYLDNNNLELLPDKFFEKLPQLKYLDLRNNELSEIPNSGLSNHKNLQVLLLSRNSITHLPLDLGFVKSLNALHWVGNPIEFPSLDVLEQSSDDMKKSLRRIKRDRLREENGEKGTDKKGNDKTGNDKTGNDRTNKKGSVKLENDKLENDRVQLITQNKLER